MSDAITQFRNAIEDAELVAPDVIEADGKLHRFASNGKRGDTAGYYVLHDDGLPAGAFGCWRTGVSVTWRADSGRRVSRADAAVYRARAEALRREKEAADIQRKAEARVEAAAIFSSALPAPDDHVYLIRKKVTAHGLRLRGQELIVPMLDDTELHSLQFIHPNGEKYFLEGGRVKGCYFTIGQPNDTLCIVEGFATGATVREVTGYAVAIAFNCGNLPLVALALRMRFPAARLIVCADDDAGTPGNPGLTKAREAAHEVGGLLAIPEFGAGRPEGVTDFNDLHRLAGPAAVRACIDRATAAATNSTPTGWPQPKPIIAELKPVPAFDAETLLPESLRAWVMDEAERMPCPPEFIAAPVVVALSSIIGARCAIRPKTHDSWMEVANVWGGIVGDPAAKKTPALGVALKPLDRLIAKAREEHRAALADYDVAKMVHAAQKDAIAERIKKAARDPANGDPAVIARELRAHDEQAPVVPALRRYKSNDCTVEKLGELLRDSPVGLLVMRDELVGLLANWDREGREGERAFFLEAWNGKQSYDTDRIGRGHISIPNVCVSILGGIQPDKLIVYLEQAAESLANDGMLQRFQMLVYPDPRRWEWRDRPPNKAARDAAYAIFETLAAFDPVAWGAAPADDFVKFPAYGFDDAAQAVFIEWSADLHGRVEKEPEPIIKQHLAKFDKLFPTLALIFHLVDGAACGVRGPVTRNAALRAAAWCEFLEAHARRCYGLLMDDGLRATQALAARLERDDALKDGFTLRDVRRHQWSHLKDNEAIQAALDWLEDEGWLRGEATGGAGPGSGRPTTRYQINPAVKARRTETAG